MSAYAFARNAEAWRLFWRERHIDADALTAGNHHGWLLRYCQERMPGAAPTRADLAARRRRPGAADPPLVTADDLRAGWRQLFEACAGHVMRAGGAGRGGG